MADEEKIDPQDEVQVSGNQGDETPMADNPDGEVAIETPETPVTAEPGDAVEPNAESDADSKEFTKVVNAGDASEEEAEAAMLSMLENLPEDDNKPSPEDIRFGGTDVSNAEFQHLSEPSASPDARNIDLLMDVNLPISIELGRTRMSIADILGLGPGSVVELNKLAGEPVDVMVNHKIVAKGEVVVIDENFGVRITQLMTPAERLKLLSNEQ